MSCPDEQLREVLRLIWEQHSKDEAAGTLPNLVPVGKDWLDDPELGPLIREFAKRLPNE